MKFPPQYVQYIERLLVYVVVILFAMWIISWINGLL